MNALHTSSRGRSRPRGTLPLRKRTLSATEGSRDDESGGTMNTAPLSSDGDTDSSTDSSSSTGCSSSSSSDNSSSSSSSVSSDEGSMENVFEEDEYGRFLNVSCANNEAKFYIKRFARGSVGKCILFKKRWITPNEFQAISGRKSSKDWKRSIRLKGRCLKEFITQGLFQEHAKTCACKICSGDDVDILKQEGEMALAAKRRRLSQADTHSITPNEPHGVIGGGPPPLLPQAPPPTTFEQPEPMEDMNSSSKRSSTELDRGDGGIVTPQKIWSPSGELAGHDNGSSNEEEEYQPEEDPPMELKGVVDSRDFLPRRSRRSVNKKNNGHRTELGTFRRKPSSWDPEEVAEFLKIHGYEEYADPFVESEIDGQSLFLLREQHLMERFNMKLGPALTLIDTICRLRHPPLVSS